MLGVCYYPEHWSRQLWQRDAEQMRDLGLEVVRIGEFCWSRIEPEDGLFKFKWLDEAIGILAAQGLNIVFGTPTATPPKWLIDKYPDILPVDPNTGATRRFGSRRHVDFSSENFLREAKRITEILVKRYGDHPAIIGWQTDNELGCHDTTLSASPAAKYAFQNWCKHRYQNIRKLNQAWGNVFWSMEYNNFEQIELPVLTVTEANPAHRLAYQRFASDQLVAFHRDIINIIRAHAPDRFITHNFIPMCDTEADNFALAEGLDFVSFDNYPLGRSDLFFADSERTKIEPYQRTGHPDYSAYFFDQVRGLSVGDFWIMEQQPGPVNWAHNNPRPEPGMVKFWSMEAFAHGAECVSYFRWRQIPFAQEQMHAGLLRNDSTKARAWDEIKDLQADLAKLNLHAPAYRPAKVALMTDADARWVTRIEQQGVAFDFEKVEFAFYSVLRELGIDVDFVSVDSDVSKYSLVVAPCLPVIPEHLIDTVKNSDALWLFGPRSGSKTAEFSLPDNLAPGALQTLLPVKVLSVDTTHPEQREALQYKGETYQSFGWREELEQQDCEIVATYANGSPALLKNGPLMYLGCLTDADFMRELFTDLCTELEIENYRCAEGLRVVRRNNLVFLFNYSNQTQTANITAAGDFIIGSMKVEPYSYSVFQNL
ncbi:MAG: beta-galactosidase [Gammaproteobacteria bacterium]|nr:beta-galactosidase [Gammaproteobacteria bacterium]